MKVNYCFEMKQVKQQNPTSMAATTTAAATPSSFLFFTKLLFMIVMITSPAAVTAALEKVEESNEGNVQQNARNPFLWHPSRLLQKDYLSSSSSSHHHPRSPINHEDLLDKLMRTDAVHAAAMEVKINVLLIPRELQQDRIIKGIHDEMQSIEKAISVVQDLGAVNKQVILEKLGSRKVAADRRLREMLNKCRETLANVDAFLNFVLKRQKELMELKTNQAEDNAQNEKIDAVIDALQRKQLTLESYIQLLDADLGNAN